MIYYIGDTHFGHENVIRHDARPFANAEEMDRIIMDNWNAVVKNTDDIYVLGDFCFRNRHDPCWYLQQLKGRKHLITGNHDVKILKNEQAMGMFESVNDLKAIKDNGRQIILCHYPMASWDRAHHGSWHVYAHIHNNINDVAKHMFTLEHAVNAGCMIHDYRPVTFDEMLRNYNWFRERAMTREEYII